MPFMEYHTTEKQEWILIDGDAGVTFIPADVDLDLQFAIVRGHDAIAEDLAMKYYDGAHIYSVELTEGYGARMTAPGYMDCTPWNVFDTLEEAEQYLRDEYPQDDGENEEGDEEDRDADGFIRGHQ